MADLIVWRLCQARWAETALSGEGAARYPGRWNSAGVPLVYCAESRALACLELLAHVEDKALLAAASFVAIPVVVPLTKVTAPTRFPKGWDALPPNETSRRVGDRFVTQGESVALRVPSFVVRGEHNLLLNPRHPDFGTLQIGQPAPFSFDPRLAR